MIVNNRIKMQFLFIILVFGLGIVFNNIIHGSNIPIEFSLLVLTTIAIFITDPKSAFGRFRSRAFLIISVIGLVLMYLSLTAGGI